MAASKSRLGRGLQSLIAGGLAKPAKPAPAKKAPAPSGKASAPAAKGSVPAAAKSPAPVRAAAAKKSRPEPKPAPAPAAPVAAAPAAPAVAAAAVPPSPWAEIAVADLEPNPYQPRREFDPAQLAELADSIRSEGLLQPVVVRRKGTKFQLVAGERRWRACQQLKLRTIPARIVEASDASSAVIALIENLQRENLNPIEEAHGYASLLRDFDLTQEAVSERVGKARASVANALRLLTLPREIQALVQRGQLSVGHAKVLLGVEDEAQRAILARRVVEGGLSVRQTEQLLKTVRASGTSAAPAARPVAALEMEAIRDLERQLASKLKTRVKLQHTAKRGRLVIEYYGNDDLQRLLESFGLGGS